MNSMTEYRNTGIFYNPAVIDQQRLTTILTASKSRPMQPDRLIADVSPDTSYEAAFDQAWAWMNEDQDGKEKLERSGLTKESLSAAVKQKLSNVQLDPEAEAARAKSLLQVTETKGGRVVHYFGGVPAIAHSADAKDTSLAGIDQVVAVIALVADFAGLVFVIAGVYIQAQTLRTAASGAAKLLSPETISELKRLGLVAKAATEESRLSDLCAGLGEIMNNIGDLVKNTVTEAANSLSPWDWAIAIGSLLATIAGIILSGGASLVCKIGELLCSALQLATDAIQLA